MIKIEITAHTPEEYREWIETLADGVAMDGADIGSVSATAGLGSVDGYSHVVEAIRKTEDEAFLRAQQRPQTIGPIDTRIEVRTAAAAETRTRKPRTPKETPAPETAPAISTGEERVDPRDTADEAAEAAAAKEANGGLLTLNDVRRACKAYADKYGHDAGVHDLRDILGCAIPEIPLDDQAALSAAIGKIEAAIANGRPSKPAAPELQQAAAAQANAEPKKPNIEIISQTGVTVQESSLFGEPAAAAEPEPPKTATPGEFKQACMDYSKRFDPKMATDPMQSTLMQDDVKKLSVETVGTSDPRVVVGDPTNTYKVVVAVKKAIEENPFKR